MSSNARSAVETRAPASTSDHRIGDEDLRVVVRRLAAELAPEKIYLFGSQVDGDPRTDSDIDLFIIAPDAESRRVELACRGYACLHGLGLGVELHFASPSQFQKFSTVVGSIHREILLKGRVIHVAKA